MNLIKITLLLLTIFLITCASENNQQEASNVDSLEITTEETAIDIEENKEPMSPGHYDSVLLARKDTIELSPIRKLAEGMKKTTKHSQVNWKVVDSIVKISDKLPDEVVARMEIKKHTNPWHENFVYYIFDTIHIKQDIKALLIIEYFESESFGYLFSYKNDQLIDKIEVFYDNAEGFYSKWSDIFENNTFFVDEWDMTKEGRGQAQECCLYVLDDDGKFQEVTIEVQ